MTGNLVDRATHAFLATHPGESARVLEAVSSSEAASVLEQQPADVAAEVLGRMRSDTPARVLVRLTEPSAKAVLAVADFVQIARWLGYLERKEASRLEALLPRSQARNVAEAMSYPEGTAGKLMDPRVLSFPEDAQIEAVLSKIREVKDRRISDVLLVDTEGRLAGKVALQNLLGAEEGVTVGSLAQRPAPSVTPMTTRDEVVDMLSGGKLASLAVVALDGRLIGVLRHDALVQAAQDGAAADALQMVGAAKEERALSPPFFAVKSRLPWLLINLVTAFVAASVVGLFDATIAKFTALAVLMPVVAGQSGNTGAQALAVTSRGLALREIRIGHWFRVVMKEGLASVANGVAVAAVTCAGVFLWSGNNGLTLVIGVSMVISMFLAAVSGAIIPIILTALNRDPATASSIVLTTVTDVAGFFSFLGLATLLSDMLV